MSQRVRETTKKPPSLFTVLFVPSARLAAGDLGNRKWNSWKSSDKPCLTIPKHPLNQVVLGMVSLIRLLRIQRARHSRHPRRSLIKKLYLSKNFVKIPKNFNP